MVPSSSAPAPSSDSLSLRSNSPNGSIDSSNGSATEMPALFKNRRQWIGFLIVVRLTFFEEQVEQLLIGNENFQG